MSRSTGFILLFFPSVTFSLINAEIFPWALIISLFLIVQQKFIVTKQVIVYSSIILLSATYTFAVFKSYDEIIRSVIAYLNPLLIYLLLKKTNYRLHQSAIISLRIILFFLLLQILVPGLIENLVGILLRRGSTDWSGSRGISALSSEPSRLGYEIIFIYLIIREKYSYKKLFDILILAIQLFVIKSFTGFVFTLIMLAAINPRKFILISVASISILTNYFLFNPQSRAISTVYKILSSSSLIEITELLMTQSGFRGLSLISTLFFALNNPIGYGIGNWKLSSNHAILQISEIASQSNYLQSRNIDLTDFSFRPTSFSGNLFLDFGTLGLIFSILFAFYILKRNGFTPINSTFLFYFFVIGTVGNPIPWIALALHQNSNE